MFAQSLLCVALVHTACGLGYAGYGGYSAGHLAPLHPAAGLGLHHPLAAAPLHAGHALALPHPIAHVGVPLLHHHHDEAYDSVILTCKTEDAGAADQLSINIKNKKYSPWMTKMGLAKQYGPGLEATVNVKAGTAAEYSVVFSDMVRDDCSLVGMGNLVCPKNYLGYGHVGYGGYGYGGYGGYGHGLGYGIASHPGNNYGFDLDHAHPIPGVLTTGSFDDKKASVYVDRLYGFKSLSELAGRGVTLCPKDQVKMDANGAWECALKDSSVTSETAVACCSLQYANDEMFIA